MYTIGRVLNRFSKDVGFIDDVLPYIFCEYLVVSCRAKEIEVLTVHYTSQKVKIFQSQPNWGRIFCTHNFLVF